MIERGCGTRDQNALYACVETSPFGKSIEWFLTDPVKPWQGGTIRAPMLIQDPRTKIYHLVLGIGVTYYPFVSDFVEEARRIGISKRVPNNFDTSKLNSYRSGMVLVHPRALPEFDYSVDSTCPKEQWNPNLHDDGSLCIGDLWELSSAKSYKDVHELEENDNLLDQIKVRIPSTTYFVGLAYEKDSETIMQKKRITNYKAGSILFFPHFHFEYVNEKGEAPKDLVEPIIAQGWPFKVVDE